MSFLARLAIRSHRAIGRQTRRYSFTSSRNAAAPVDAGFGLRINADRLQESIHHTCQWGAAHRYGEDPTQTGMCRLALSDDDARARRWFEEETRKVGCGVKVDQMGNMFACRPGASVDRRPMTAMGSHLDTQPRGGRYDGILGVTAALEVLRTLHDNGYQTNFDVGAINWTNEEGARFPKSMLASGVWAGAIPLEDAWQLRDIFNPEATVRSELERIGYLGSMPCSSQAYPLGAHFELHIEQGPILESAGKKIGVVQGAQAYRWLTVNVQGRDTHTGTTPYATRKDPLLAAAKMIAASNAVGHSFEALVTTGVIKIPPTSSTNTVAAEVTFTLDIRHARDHVVEEVQAAVLERFGRIAAEDGRGVAFSWTLDSDSRAASFDAGCIAAVEDAARRLVGPDGWLPVTSGAGHDSVYASKQCPTTMIFVPCKDGMSHNPEEYCSPEDCAIGAQVLLEAVLGYDQLRLGLRR
ncbi:putative beta-alanine synthase [Stachybotrys elegans]|uniref:Beta-alanine synthase n=1 Tax=Stachybotrys elegans TaxID=80388 RepID=A0A8K0WR40_9HYPO|nr:putative beta-alanine synthase [Stachybotrys elegans]